MTAKTKQPQTSTDEASSSWLEQIAMVLWLYAWGPVPLAGSEHAVHEWYLALDSGTNALRDGGLGCNGVRGRSSDLMVLWLYAWGPVPLAGSEHAVHEWYLALDSGTNALRDGDLGCNVERSFECNRHTHEQER